MKLKNFLVLFIILAAFTVVFELIRPKISHANLKPPSSTESSAKAENTSDSRWKYTVKTADDLLKNKFISGEIVLTPYANALGFHMRKREHGNYTVQTAPGILPGLMSDQDIFHSPSHECINTGTTGVSLPDSIVLWNDDQKKVAVLTYCVNSEEGFVEYNNDASEKMTVIIK